MLEAGGKSKASRPLRPALKQTLAADPRLGPGSGCGYSRPPQAAFRQALRETASVASMRSAVLGHAGPSQQGLGQRRREKHSGMLAEAEVSYFMFLRSLKSK